MSARSKVSTGHEAPERPSRQGAAPQPGAVARDGIELLLKQFVERLGEADVPAGVHQLQRQVSALAKSYGADTGEDVEDGGKARPYASSHFPDEARDVFLANARGWDDDGLEQTARELAPERFPGTQAPALSGDARPGDTLEHFFGSAAPALLNDARPDKDAAGNLWQRDWFEHRFSELKSLIVSTGSLGADERLSAVEQRLDEISSRLDAMRKSPAQTEALQLVERQMRILANHLAHSKDWQQSAQHTLGTLNAKVDTLGQMTNRTMTIVAESGKRSEAAIFVAVEKGAQRASDLTARRFAEGLQQALPAARFAVIEQEIRALSQHQRETGQRSARAMEDVRQALSQVLQQNPAANGAQHSNRRAGIGDPIQTPAPKAVQRPRWPESGIPGETVSHTGWNSAPAPSVAKEREFASANGAAPLPDAAPSSWELETRRLAGVDNAWRPLDTAPAKPQAAPEPAAHAAPAFEFTQGHPGADGEYPENGRQLKSGLIAAAIILLLASAGMLYLNLTAKKFAVHAPPAATSMHDAPASAMAVATVVDVVGLEWPDIAVSTPAPALQIDLGRGKASARVTTIFKTSAAAVQHREDAAAAQDFDQLKRLAEQNDPVAQYRLAASYERGRGVAKNLTLAELWYARAAARGNVLAMHNLGSLHAAKNRPQNNRLAVAWFQKAAQYGLAGSEYNLGLILEKGIGVTANPVEAYKWYSLAAAAGDREADRRRAALGLRLSPAEIQRAEGLAAAWKPLPWPARADPADNSSDQA